MLEEQEKVRNKIINAYKKLLEKDNFLLEDNLNERTITHKFAYSVLFLVEEDFKKNTNEFSNDFFKEFIKEI